MRHDGRNEKIKSLCFGDSLHDCPSINKNDSLLKMFLLINTFTTF